MATKLTEEYRDLPEPGLTCREILVQWRVSFGHLMFHGVLILNFINVIFMVKGMGFRHQAPSNLKGGLALAKQPDNADNKVWRWALDKLGRFSDFTSKIVFFRNL